MKTKVTLTQDELKKALFEQRKLIEELSRVYDGGVHVVAKSIAVHLRALLHDTKQSKSLLQSLNIKEKLSFLNSAIPYNEANLLSHTGLTVIAASPRGANYEPLGNAAYKEWQIFDKWWEDIVIRDKNGHLFSRKDIILNIADTDGGAHTDPAINEKYYGLSRENSAGCQHIDSELISSNIELIELASIRQIAFEIVSTLDWESNQIVLKNLSV